MPDKNNIPPLPSGFEEVPPLPSGYEAVEEQPLKKKEYTETESTSASKPLMFKDVKPYSPPSTITSEGFVSEAPSTKGEALNLEEPLKKAQEQQQLSWKDTPEGVRLDVQNNAIKNSSLIFNAKQQTLIDNSKKQFQENPIFSESNPNSKRNKEIYVQKLADMGYDKKVISDQLGVEYDPNSAESVVNSIINIPTKIELSLPRAKLAVMDILVDFATQPLIGERNTVEDIPELKAIQDYRNEVYGEKRSLDDELLPTKKIIDSYREKDAAGLLAASFDAVTAIASTAATAIPTMGASIFTDMAGDFISSANEEKAKSMGVSVEELYNMGENELAAPVALSILGGLAEYAGISGMKDVVLNSIKSGTGKKALDILMAGNKEGLTEWFQFGLEEYNKLRTTETTEVAAKETFERMVSKEGRESYLQGAVGGTGATGAGVLLNKKSELETEVKKAQEEGRIEDAQMYANEAQKVDEQIQNEIINKTNTDTQKVEGEIKVENDKAEVSRLEGELAKEDLTETGKEVLQNKISELKQSINETESKIPDTEVAAEPTQTSEINQPVIAEAEIVEPIKTQPDAIQEPKTESVLQREQGEVRETGSERVGMEQGEQGVEATQESEKQKVEIPPIIDERRADYKAEKSGMTFANDGEFFRYVAEESESPAEIAEVYLMDAIHTEKGNTVIGDYLDRKGYTILPEDYSQYGDPNNLDDAAKKYISATGGTMDDLVLQLSDELNRTVSPQEVIDYIEYKQFEKNAPKESEIKTKLRKKYKELTGQELSPSAAEKVLEAEAKRISKEYGKVIEQEFASRDEAERAFRAAIESGEITINEVGEIVDISEGGKGAQPKKTGIKKAELKKIRDKFGFPDLPTQEKMKMDELEAEAKRLLKENPNIINERIDAIKNGNQYTPLDTALFNQYVASLQAKIKENPSEELLNELNYVVTFVDTTGSMAGRVLRSLKETVPIEDSLGGWQLEMRDANNDVPLSREEKESVTQMYDKYEAASEKETQARIKFEKLAFSEDAQKEIDRLKKELEAFKKEKPGKLEAAARKKVEQIKAKLKKEKKKISLKDKDGNEIFIDEGDIKTNGISQDKFIDLIGEALIQSAKAVDVVADAVAYVIEKVKDSDWYKKLDDKGKEKFESIVRENVESVNSEIDYDKVEENIEKAKLAIDKKGLDKDTAKLVRAVVKDIVAAGETNLETVAQKASEALDGIIAFDDVISVLGGKYAPKETRTDLNAKMQYLSDLAKLYEKYDRIMRGEVEEKIAERPKKEQAEFANIRKKIKEAEAYFGINERDAIVKRKQRIENDIKALRKRIDEGDFTPKKRVGVLANEELKKRHPKEAKGLLDAIREKMDVKHEFETAKIKKEVAGRNKIAAQFKKGVGTIGKIGATLDLSWMGVHGYYVLFTNPKIWGEGYAKSLSKIFSKEAYIESIESLKDDKELWDELQFSKVDIYDLEKLREEQRDSQLMRSFFDEHEVNGVKVNIGKYVGTEIADRAFTVMGNTVRVMLYKLHSEKLKEQGKTIYTHPEDYKALGKYINNLTGRGDVAKIFKSDFFNALIWSPRKWASRMNMLFLSDIFYAPTSEKGFYGSLTRDVQKIAAKDMAKIIGVGLAIMAASGLSGADVDDDIESPTWGTITFPNGFQFEPFGEMTGIVRNLLRIARAFINKEGRTNAIEETLKYIRKKLHPLSGISTDLIMRRTVMGEEVYERRSWMPKGEYLQNRLTPMSVNSIVDEVERDPLAGFIMTPAYLTGFPVRNSQAYEELQSKIKFEREMRKRMDERDPMVRREKAMKKREKERRNRLKIK